MKPPSEITGALLDWPVPNMKFMELVTCRKQAFDYMIFVFEACALLYRLTLDSEKAVLIAFV